MVHFRYAPILFFKILHTIKFLQASMNRLRNLIIIIVDHKTCNTQFSLHGSAICKLHFIYWAWSSIKEMSMTFLYFFFCIISQRVWVIYKSYLYGLEKYFTSKIVHSVIMLFRSGHATCSVEAYHTFSESDIASFISTYSFLILMEILFILQHTWGEWKPFSYACCT